MGSLTLEQALAVIDGTFQAGQKSHSAPLTVAVLDSGGKLITLQRQDGSSMMRPDIAIAKAWGALALGCSSRKLAQDADNRPAFISAVNVLAHGNMVPVPGGLLIRDAEQNLLGAVGVSGDISDLDESCALRGITHADLFCDENAV
ncbi:MULTISPECIES: GlcG/HbpS family heme-binding protein [Vibrio]|uniref:GlcG/HbpS family heme-binding protein n=1 Tax=Vibrio TaxID=662 RepID=UPI0005FA0580|nr:MULTISPECIES: heme-binding protein [Vibrio]KJY86820.1 GlcG protein [Vibrio neptunius]MDA0117436.1 heme-binding protein [Vibrio sp. T11.5]NRB67553.1 heme-binding protein [Vibrio sp.]